MLAELLDQTPTRVLGDEAHAVVSALVAFDAECSCCVKAGEAFRQALREISPLLTETIPIMTAPLAETAEWFLRECDIDRRSARWKRLRVGHFDPITIHRTDGLHAPQCVLVLSAHHFTDPEARSRLAAHCAVLKDEFSGFLIVFLDRTGRLLPRGIRSGELEQWLRDFDSLTPAEVSVHLLSRSFEGGQPVDEENLAEAVAIALCHDLVLPHPASPRILTGARFDGARLSTFGIRALRFRADLAAQALHRQWAADMLRRTFLHGLDKRSSEEGAAPTPSEDAMGQTASTVSSGAGSLSVALPALPLEKMQPPCFDAASINQLLDQTPSVEWGDKLREWRDSLVEEQAPETAAPVQRALASLRHSASPQLRQSMAEEIGCPRGASRLRDTCARARALVGTHFDNTRGGPDRIHADLESALKQLDVVLSEVPSRRRWCFRAALFATLPASLAGAVYLHGLEPRALWLGLLAGWLVVALLAVARWKRAVDRRVREARDGAVDAAVREGQKAFAKLVKDALDGVRGGLHKEIDTIETKIGNVRDRLFLLNAHASEAEAAFIPLAVIQMPVGEGMHRRLLDWLDQRTAVLSGSAGFGAVFCGPIKEALAKTLSGEINASQAVEEIRAFAEDTLHRCFGRLQLWHFFRTEMGNDAEAPCPSITTPVFAQLSDRPAVCLQGQIIGEALAHPDRATRLLVASPVLHPYAPNGFAPAEAILSNVAAIMTTVELLRIAPRVKGNEDGLAPFSAAAENSPA